MPTNTILPGLVERLPQVENTETHHFKVEQKLSDGEAVRSAALAAACVISESP
jgi:hypothetical protein